MRRDGESAPARLLDDRTRQRMLAVGLHRGCERKDRVLVAAVDDHRSHGGSAGRERPGLVHQHRVDGPHPFEGEPVLDEDPYLADAVVEMAITSGIARPSACGHAITSTVMVRSTA